MTLNIRDFCHNNSIFERFHAEYTENSGYSMRFFPKNWEIRINWYKINHISNNLGRKLRKIGIFTKTGTNSHTLFLQNNRMWIYISTIIKTIVFPHKNKVEKSHNLNLTKYPQIIVENTENSPNSSTYTIEYKIVRIPHLFFSKFGIFSSVMAIVLQTSSNCSYTKHQEQQLTAHTSIVERIMASVTNTHPYLQTHYCIHWCKSVNQHHQVQILNK